MNSIKNLPYNDNGLAKKPTWGNIEGILSDQTDLQNELNKINNYPQIQAPYITEVYVNGTSGYFIYSDDGVNGRLCIQWGSTNSLGSGTPSATVTLIKQYANTNYNVVNSASSHINSIANGSFIIQGVWGNGSGKVGVVHWRSIGYLS